MKKMMIFYLEHCPYCIKARRALSELIAENPAYGDIQVSWIEEEENAPLAQQYDYYYVPTIYDDQKKKLYEANPSQSYEEIKECIRKAMDAVLDNQ